MDPPGAPAALLPQPQPHQCPAEKAGRCAAGLCRRCAREFCSDPTAVTLLMLMLWLSSNVHRAYVGAPHLREGYVAPRVAQRSSPGTGTDISGLGTDADPTLLGTSFELVRRGEYPIEGYYAGFEDGTRSLHACQQVCASEMRCFMVAFNPGIALESGAGPDGAPGSRPNTCARFDYGASETRMIRGPHTTWRCIRQRGKIPEVRRPAEPSDAVAVIFAGAQDMSFATLSRSELLESQALMLNTLIREYRQVDIFFCVEPRHVKDLTDFRFRYESGFERELSGEKTVCFSHLCIRTIVLPRQARDKYKENSKRGLFFHSDGGFRSGRCHGNVWQAPKLLDAGGKPRSYTQR